MSTPGARPEPRPETRIGDAEREAAVSALGEHYAAGRLTKEEYDERADQAHAARTAAGLWPLFADLPRADADAPTPGGPSPVASGRPRSAWRGGAVLGPVLALVLGLLILTHLPLLLLVVLLWVVLAKTAGRRWGHGAGQAAGRGAGLGWGHPGRRW